MALLAARRRPRYARSGLLRRRAVLGLDGSRGIPRGMLGHLDCQEVGHLDCLEPEGVAQSASLLVVRHFAI